MVVIIESEDDIEIELTCPTSSSELEEEDLEDNSSSDEEESGVENGDEDYKNEEEEESEEEKPEYVAQAAANVEEDEDVQPSPEKQAQRREENIRALLDGSLDVSRKAILPKILSVQDAAVILRKPFKSPHPTAPARSESLKRALLARNQFVPWGSGQAFKPVKLNIPQAQEPDPSSNTTNTTASPPIQLPPGIEPLILWEPPLGVSGPSVRVDDALTRFLRPHQREGVQFMFECVTGLRNFDGNGCILADDMGLGKTLQGITLLWTLLSNGHPELGGSPLARRVIICCPTSLVSNWDSECTKWLNGRVRTLPLCESSREDVISTINQFLSPRCPSQLLIVSYETFRLHAERFKSPDACDLLICDEAHRLKNDQTLTNKALDSLACRRRVLLSGTPMQNQLQEFYAMVNFCNPGVLGTPSEFRKKYESPILAGREPGASKEHSDLGAERSTELSSIVNEFILRRTNTLLSQHLPPKVVEVVCCRMTPLQLQLYEHFVQSRSVRSLFSTQKSARVLSAITSLRKLLNHPKLIYDMVNSVASKVNGKEHAKATEGFENCDKIFPPGIFDNPSRGGGVGPRGSLPPGWENYSGKFAVVSRMLALLREQTRDRVVIVSNYTQTLDLFTILCREHQYPCLRLDGSTSIAKRQKLVKKFCDPQDNQFVFLLSSKAGGCGLNLVGGNRLILFDMSWNPADDKQAAARVWRDGQQRRVYVYRFMTTGTIEEKVYQRQLSKEGLQAVVDSKTGGAGGSNLMSIDELRDLFSYDPDTLSTTYDHMVAGEGRHQRRNDGHGGRKKGKCDKKTKKKKKKKNVCDDDDDDDDEEEEEEEEEDAIEVIDDNTECERRQTKSADLIAAEGRIHKEQDGKPKEEHLAKWGHHSEVSTVPDQVMAQCGGHDVTFVFSCQVDGREVPPEAPLMPFGTAASSGRAINHSHTGSMSVREVGNTKPRRMAGVTGGGGLLRPSGTAVASAPVIKMQQHPVAAALDENETEEVKENAPLVTATRATMMTAAALEGFVSPMSATKKPLAPQNKHGSESTKKGAAAAAAADADAKSAATSSMDKQPARSAPVMASSAQKNKASAEKKSKKSPASAIVTSNTKKRRSGSSSGLDKAMMVHTAGVNQKKTVIYDSDDDFV